ncbi:MAG: Nif3-like dinuclear metal center hexameric protein [Flavobacteriales bacterium]|jgi:dinuclear metal center YbgI/SA1388 family protein
MKIREILSFLENKAPFAFQESYDNSGLLVGNPEAIANGAIISLDCTEAVLDEAIEKGVNTIIAHHPIVFSGLKRLTGKSYIERVVMKAIKHDLNLISYHTNLDNVMEGVNRKMCEKLGLLNVRILDPKKEMLCKLVVFAPITHSETVRQAMFEAGAGHIGNYSECSFNAAGYGTFKGNESSQGFVGKPNERHQETEERIEVILPKYQVNQVVRAMKAVHPYEEVAHDIIPLMNSWQEVGSGMVGEWAEEKEMHEALKFIKETFGAGAVRYTQSKHQKVRRVALCGGSGSFLLPQAIQSGAQIFVSSDFKYHQFFDGEEHITIADIGHFEGEQYTIALISDWFAEKFPTFATHKTGVVTNPINYL